MAKTFRKSSQTEIKFSDRKKYFADGQPVKKANREKSKTNINRQANRPDKFVRA